MEDYRQYGFKFFKDSALDAEIIQHLEALSERRDKSREIRNLIREGFVVRKNTQSRSR
jgi:hypothetical protein